MRILVILFLACKLYSQTIDEFWKELNKNGLWVNSMWAYMEVFDSKASNKEIFIKAFNQIRWNNGLKIYEECKIIDGKEVQTGEKEKYYIIQYTDKKNEEYFMIISKTITKTPDETKAMSWITKKTIPPNK